MPAAAPVIGAVAAGVGAAGGIANTVIGATRGQEQQRTGTRAAGPFAEGPFVGGENEPAYEPSIQPQSFTVPQQPITAPPPPPMPYMGGGYMNPYKR